MLRIRFERQERNITLRELAEQSEINPSNLSLIERGLKAPCNPEIDRLEEVMDIAREKLFEEVEVKS